MLDILWFTKWLLILLSDISYQQLSYVLQILGKKIIEIGAHIFLSSVQNLKNLHTLSNGNVYEYGCKCFE